MGLSALSSLIFNSCVNFVTLLVTFLGEIVWLLTLVLYETVLDSVLLRLLRETSLEAKKYRMLETTNGLSILAIKDSRIGESGCHLISGGDKRRILIICELVTSPLILFLDESTFNLVDSLVILAHDYNQTIIFTIHQPCSDSV
ncbi:hypothetical protein BD769DRAFT_1358060 [Suillus cothurnatus]|nr:hypothetical protein BD769DRAFT_1358060 [Suillus cothurnatus]